MPKSTSYSNLSIALCTYNGEKYLNSQLESIAVQDPLPSEIVIQDDASMDNTMHILENFKHHAPFEIILRRNQCTVGFAQNYAHAIDQCQAEIVALCDQDDIWRSNKTAIITDILRNPEIGLVFSNAVLVDQQLRTIGYDLWESTNFSKNEIKLMRNEQETAVLLKHYIVTGATLAFRSKFIPLVLPIPPNWNHDSWIALLISSVSRVWPISEKLILYRQHSNNAIGSIKRNLINQIKQGLSMNRKKYYKIEITRYQDLFQRLIRHPEFHPKTDSLHQIEAKIRHLERRASLSPNRLKRLPKIAKEFSSNGYSRFARNWGSIALDLFIH